MDKQGENRDENCERFFSASGSDRETKERNACFNCKFFPTKTGKGKAENSYFDNIIQTAERKREIRDSMRTPIDDSSVSYLEFEAIIILDEYERQFAESERRELLKTMQILRAVFTK